MYLEHISVVHSVRGDISRTAALEKLGLLALSLWRLAEPGRLPRQRLAVIAVDLALLLRRQLRKPHLTGVALNQCSSAPPNMPSLEWEGTRKPPHPPLYILTASTRRCWGLTVHLRKAYSRKSPSQWETTDITSVISVGNTELAFYLAPHRDVQSPVKGQGDRMSGSEGGPQCRNNGTCWELF